MHSSKSFLEFHILRKALNSEQSHMISVIHVHSLPMVIFDMHRLQLTWLYNLSLNHFPDKKISNFVKFLWILISQNVKIEQTYVLFFVLSIEFFKVFDVPKLKRDSFQCFSNLLFDWLDDLYCFFTILLKVEGQHAQSDVHKVSVGSFQSMTEFVLMENLLYPILEESQRWSMFLSYKRDTGKVCKFRKVLRLACFFFHKLLIPTIIKILF